MARDLRTLVSCLHRDAGILVHKYVSAPHLHPRPDLWDLVDLLLDSALLVERLALGIDAWGELHEPPARENEKPLSADNAQGLDVSQVEETCDD
jgi:hypothetical protein